MSSRSEGLAALRARAAEKAAPGPPAASDTSPAPSAAPQAAHATPASSAKAGGRPPNVIRTIPVNLHVPEDMMEGLVQIAYQSSTPRRRLTPQKVILDLIRERVTGHG